VQSLDQHETGQAGYFGRFKGMLGSAISYVKPTTQSGLQQMKQNSEKSSQPETPAA